jgi:hypothetical protein
VPFEHLAPDIAREDEPYVHAIHVVARGRAAK